jgi:hypothetical protein
MIKIALLVVAVIALGVFTGMEMWSKHQEEVKTAQVQELMRQLIGSPTPGGNQSPTQPHTPWEPAKG